MKITSLQLFNSEATNATVESEPFPVSHLIRYTGQVVVLDPDTNVDGSLKIQISNDTPSNTSVTPFVPTNWSDLGSAVTVSAEGVTLIPITEACFLWIKAVYTDNSSGVSTATISVNLNAQGN